MLYSCTHMATGNSERQRVKYYLIGSKGFTFQINNSGHSHKQTMTIRTFGGRLSQQQDQQYHYDNEDDTAEHGQCHGRRVIVCTALALCGAYTVYTPH